MACKCCARGSKYRPGKRFLCGCIFTTLCSVALTCFTMAVIYFDRDNISVSPNNGYYLPGDTWLVNYSSFWCQGLTMSSINGSASLYMESEAPILSEQTSLHHSDVTTSPNDNYWYGFYYHLHANSSIFVQGCSSYDLFYILIIEGQAAADTFTSAVDNNGDWRSCCSIQSVEVTTVCDSGNNTMNYTTLATGKYFIMIYASTEFTTATVSWSINCTEYRPSDTSESCSSSDDVPCTLDVPFLSNYTALLVKNISEDANGLSLYPVSIHCESRPAALVIAMIVVSIAAMCAFTVVSCVCVRCCCQRYFSVEKTGMQAPLLGGNFRPYDPDTTTGTTCTNYPKPDPVPATNYPRPNPTLVNYPRPGPVPATNYPRPNTGQVSNYPRPNPTPVNYSHPASAPVNNYPRPGPVSVNNNPHPNSVQINNFPSPDPNPVVRNYYPAPYPQLVVNQYPRGQAHPAMYQPQYL